MHTWTIWSFTEILQYKVEKRIHFELIATSTSRDELGKLSGQRGQGCVKSTGKSYFGLFEIKLQLLTPKRNITSLELYYLYYWYYKAFVFALSQSETTRPQT